MPWKRKRRKRNIIQRTLGNYWLRNLLIIFSTCIIVAYIIVVLLPGQKYERLGPREKGIKIIGVPNAQWSIKDGKVRVAFPYKRRRSDGRVIEQGANILYITPRISKRIPVRQELRRVRNGKETIEKAQGYISIADRKLYLERKKGIKTSIQKQGRSWEIIHRAAKEKRRRQLGRFQDQEMLLQDQ